MEGLGDTINPPKLFLVQGNLSSKSDDHREYKISVNLNLETPQS